MGAEEKQYVQYQVALTLRWNQVEHQRSFYINGRLIITQSSQMIYDIACGNRRSSEKSFWGISQQEHNLLIYTRPKTLAFFPCSLLEVEIPIILPISVWHVWIIFYVFLINYFCVCVKLKLAGRSNTFFEERRQAVSILGHYINVQHTRLCVRPDKFPKIWANGQWR